MKTTFVRAAKFAAVLSAAAVGAFVILLPTLSPARPEFSASENSPCWKCHVNPMGGGMRNGGGFFFSRKALGFEPITDAVNKKYPDFPKFVPAIGENMFLGMDARMMWYDEADDENERQDALDAGREPPPEGSSFYLMQAAFHVNALVFPILRLAYSFDAAQNTFEAYALFDDLPAGLYLRFGRFILPYGLRFEDHTIFTRDPIGFHNVAHDTGVEVGIRPGPFFATVAATNGNQGTNAMQRDHDYYAITSQAGVRFWKIGLGGSWFHNTIDDAIPSTSDGLTRNVYGPWATFGIGPVSLLGEFALVRQDVLDATAANPERIDNRIGSASVAELDVEIMQGLFVDVRYTHQDPDWRVQDDYRDQTMGGFVFYPVPFFKLIAQYRFNREEAEIDNNEMMAQAHFFF
ncbi:hypothetical protein K8I61_13840 [bacterium]|nr:hypothetical protein [bacterium]